MQMRQTPLVGPKEKWGLNVGEAIMNHPDFDGLYWFILVYTTFHGKFGMDPIALLRFIVNCSL